MKQWLWWLLVCGLWLPQTVAARATLRGVYHDDGFSDATPVAPVGGNMGTTLGEQRRLAFEYALELWGVQLESAVPIVIDVVFADESCTDTGVVLASAGPSSFFGGFTAGGANPEWLYPSALADSLVGRDLDPGNPDIQMTINSAVDGRCQMLTRGFYYGLDSKPGDRNDFIEIILHELTHGLGFMSLVDPATGQLLEARADPFTARLRDLDVDKLWPAMTASERQQSALNVRHLAWDGPLAAQALPQLLAAGSPSLTFDRDVPGYLGFVGDASFGANAASTPAAGQVVLAQRCTVAPPTAASPGWVALFTQCEPGRAVQAALNAGAAGLLLPSIASFTAPAVPLEAADPVRAVAPIVVLSSSDLQAVAQALSGGALRAQLGGDPSVLLGADANKRPLMFASRPYAQGSSVSHLEPLMRPTQLMEPFAAPVPSHDLSLTRALLMDIGWGARCGDGRLDAGEECDFAAAASGSGPACRSDCRLPRCGDGVRDQAETCDDATGNSDTRPNACRTTCVMASCGDSVIDTLEQCDRGAQNSDTQADACRRTCQAARCGDGVVDAREQCDDGARNGSANACKNDCTRASSAGRAGNASPANAGGAGASSSQPPRMTTTAAGRPGSATRVDGGVTTAGAAAVNGVDAGDAGQAVPLEPPAQTESGCGCRVVARREPAGAVASYASALVGSALAYLHRRSRRRAVMGRERRETL
jgi:hypothetical protein